MLPAFLQVQADSRLGLAELPGLRGRVADLQQQLTQAQEDAAAAQQAAAHTEQQLRQVRQQLEQAHKVSNRLRQRVALCLGGCK